MTHAEALLLDIGKLPSGHGVLAAYRLLRRHTLPRHQAPPRFPHLSDAVNRRLALGHRSGWICSICNKPCSPATGTIDHHIPRSKGGTGAPGNLRWAHKACNQKKGDTLPHGVTIVAPVAADAPGRSLETAIVSPGVFTFEIKLSITIKPDGSVSVLAPADQGIVAA